MSIKFKRGTTFAVDVAYTPTPSGPATLLDLEIRSQVRKGSTLFADLTVVVAPDGLSMQVFAPLGTELWPYAVLSWDLRFELDGSVFYSETVEIEVVREVTQ